MKSFSSLTLLLPLLLGVLITCTPNNSNPDIPLVKSIDLSQTKIIPYVQDQKIGPNINYIYCSSFQLAWNVCSDDILDHRDILIEGDPEIAAHLNKKYFTKEQLSQESYVARAGYLKEGIVETINSELREKFDHAPCFQYKGDDPDGIIAYTYLEKNLSFKPSFEGKHQISFTAGEKTSTVKAFGFLENTGSAKMKKQAVSDYYNDNDNEFIISFTPEDSNEELILAQVDPLETIEETYNKITTLRKKSHKIRFGDDDTLLIPKISLFVDHDYNELKGKKVLNFTNNPVIVVEAKQTVKFNLDETGATLKSISLISFAKSCPSRVIFNRPFMIIMKEKEKELPYLIMWISNTEFMTVE